MISRVSALVLVFSLLICAPARSQNSDAEEQWKRLVMQALYAASSSHYTDAEAIFVHAMHEAERFGPEDARVGTTLNSLGLIYRAEKKYSEAETSYHRALGILEKAYGAGSIDVANVNFNIATVMFDQNHHQAALPYIQKAMLSYQGLLGATSLKTASALCMLGDAYRILKSFVDAEEPLRRCADIREKDGGIQNPDLAEAQHSLAMVFQGQGKLDLAEPRYKLAEKIQETTLGITSPVLAQTMDDHAALLHQMGRDKEAQKLLTMVAAIRRSQRK